MIKRVLSSILVLVMLISLFGCGKKDEVNNEEVKVVDSKEAGVEEYKTLITNLLDALVAGDYAKAKTYFYTDSETDFEEYCKNAEEKNNFKFSDGYNIRRYTEEYYTDGDKPVKGVVYVYDLHVNFGDAKCYALVQIIDDGKKVGIIGFEIASREVADTAALY